ncbi:hypothetical protein [Ethanoligenens sp.]|uniref:hypothetical protein n=1 Tax=Ethanoligenens sp. TaxID=2099655 RepID=UPI0039E9598C
MYPSSHRNPIKRNRNIGTRKSGNKRQSKFEIPSQNYNPFYKNIQHPKFIQRTVGKKTFQFIVEQLKDNYIYTCSIDEICAVLSRVPPNDLDGLSLIVLRQPKKKEEIIDPCWGRIRYFFEFDRKLQPAIIIEAIDPSSITKITKKGISPFFQKELDMLSEEGNRVSYDKRNIRISKTTESAKNTQLYRTLLHEIGHYVAYKRGNDGNTYEDQEVFANNYAKAIMKHLC